MSQPQKRVCLWAHRKARQERAIQRNEKHRAKYEAMAREKKLEGAEFQAFVNHKIGIPKKKR